MELNVHHVLQELVVALSHLVVQYESNFCTVALQFIEEEKNYTVPSPANTAGTVVQWASDRAHEGPAKISRHTWNHICAKTSLPLTTLRMFILIC